MADQAATVRRCIGSERFGIESHEAPTDDFPKQPSQKDGLGRMCKTHWNEYTAGLAREAKARKAAEADAATLEPEGEASAEPERPRKRRSTKSAPVAESPVAEAQADAG